jgi:hypothetical protein
MANLSTKIKMYCDANGVSEVDFLENVMLQDDSDGKGAYIKEWNLDIAQPTDAQLSAHIGEQLDEIYKDIDAWKARIKSIKDANPKS